MAIFGLDDFRAERPATADATGIFRRVAEAVAQWRLRRRTIAELSHLDERQQRDVGFRSPETYDPTNGGARSLWRQALFGPDAP